MKKEFPSDFYQDMIKELERLKKENATFADTNGSVSLSQTIAILKKEMKWYKEQKWYDEDDIREEFGKIHPITDGSVLAWEELENMLIGEQISYMAESLGLEYNERMGAWV